MPTNSLLQVIGEKDRQIRDLRDSLRKTSLAGSLRGSCMDLSTKSQSLVSIPPPSETLGNAPHPSESMGSIPPPTELEIEEQYQESLERLVT